MARMTGAVGMGATVGADCGVGKAGSGPVDVDGLDLAPCAFGDTVEREGTDAGAVEPDNGEVVGGEHAADLVVAPLEEPDGGGAGAGEGEGGWAAGFGFAVEEERAGGEDIVEAGGDVSVDGDLVGFGGFVAWGGPAVDVGAIVG